MRCRFAQSLGELSQAADRMQIEDLAYTSRHPGISANLCESLLLLRPTGERSYLNITVCWSRALLPDSRESKREVQLRQEVFDVAEVLAPKLPDRHGFWGGRRLRRFPQGAEVSVSKSELLVAEQVERADFSSADICSAKPPAVPEAVKRHRKPPEGRVLQGFHEPPPKSVTVRKLRSVPEPRIDRFIGFVDELRGQPLPDIGLPSGEVRFTLFDQGEEIRAKADLDEMHYSVAGHAHLASRVVSFKGVLERLPRLNRIRDVTDFKIIEVDDGIPPEAEEAEQP